MKSGDGTLALSGESSFSGALTVDAGVLSLRMPGPVRIGNELNGTGTIINETGAALGLGGNGAGFTGLIDANGQDVELGGPNSGPGSGGMIALNGGTLKLGGVVEGSLFYGQLPGGNSPSTTPLPPTSDLTTTASVIQGGIPASTTLALDGEIWLTAGNWSFSKTCDDGGYVAIDGRSIINNSGWTAVVFGTFTAPADGWYSFTARVSNGGGGSGPHGAPFSIGIYKGVSHNINDYIAFEIGALGTRCRVVPASKQTRMAGGLILGGGGANVVNPDDGDLTIDGPVEGGPGDELVKAGVGSLTLTGVSTMTGPVTVQQGTLVVGAGGSVESASMLTVNGGTTLAGEGTCGPVNVFGKILPGASGIGTLTTGTLTFMQSAVFKPEINSDNGVADKLVVAGDITIDPTAVMLPLDLGSTALPNGTKLVLVEYTGTLTGTFAGRPEGSQVVLGPNTFTLSYADNGGTAVTLTIGGGTGSDYDTWADSYGLTGADRLAAADPDGDDVINQDEYAFGLDPTSGASATPITTGLDQTTGTFTYTRRDPALTGATYTVETSTNLSIWSPDAGAVQTVISTAGQIQTVSVKLSQALLSRPKLFARVTTGEGGGGVSDYDAWASGFSLDPAANGAPGEDPDGDDVINQDEYAFGLDPTDPASLNPVTVPLDPATGSFTYTRRDPALTGLTYSYEYSTDLANWTTFQPAGEIQNGTTIQTVVVTVPSNILANPMVFVRPVAN